MTKTVRPSSSRVWETLESFRPPYFYFYKVILLFCGVHCELHLGVQPAKLHDVAPSWNWRRLGAQQSAQRTHKLS